MAAATAPPAPVVVVLPDPDMDDPLYVLEANELLVAQCSFIPWQPQPAVAGAPSRVALPLSLMLHNFISRSHLDPAPAAGSAFANISHLECVPTAAFFARILTEYKSSGLFDDPLSTPLALEAALRSLIPTNPDSLKLGVADFTAAETFDAPAVPAQGGGRRNAPAVPAVPAAPGPDVLRPLALTSIASLEQPDITLPLLAWSRLAGMLGPVYTRRVRAQETSTVQTMTSVIVPNINKQLGAQNAPAATIAASLKDFILTTQLPAALRADRQDGTSLQREAQDAFRYRLGSHDERVAVEVRRIHFVRHTYA